MSVINKALSQLVTKQPNGLAGIERAKVVPVAARPAWVWALAGFAVSVAVGGWAVSWQATSLDASYGQHSLSVTASSRLADNHLEVSTPRSPTQNTQMPAVPVYRVASATRTVSAEVSQSHTAASHSAPQTVSAPMAPLPALQEQNVPALSRVKTAQAPATTVTNVPDIAVAQMSIESVQLTPEQLAHKAMARAERALAHNDFNQAVTGYSEALRHTPLDEGVRQQLAALYYGKGELRKAFDLLQRGMQLNHEGETLRIALARMLLKEEQSQAALTPLAYLPVNPSIEYLSLRAAVAQRNRVDDIALQSYRLLAEQEPSNGRWWLGLAITQERLAQWSEAKYAYQQALNHVGLSSQSHLFIRERLQALAHSEEMNLAN
ncbi:MSHA biogenesis protein MshN [Vibrio metschnikovii]|uniref:tetratricopeptide repeat protein n=1 Tax=Vibrio metschnikovii TaxID=28172 RepID=UPI0001B94B04|nr:tetratricopeptide repeat protein [Vibrio metschnikovii]EEX37992.1 MSHA biogenesis protein MshN [Vibrio metschnikovii CIP 69.14]SUP08020.1 MSHA biogenesis protein MshN [Vibrio metschnikovii]SUP51099.1 MSHA biogenesis protein MshN [Vibrio metschnikovii]